MDIALRQCLYLYWSVASCFLCQVNIHRVQTLLRSRLTQHTHAHLSCCLLENRFKHTCLHSSQCLYSTDRLQGASTYRHTYIQVLKGILHFFGNFTSFYLSPRVKQLGFTIFECIQPIFCYLEEYQ